MALLADAAHMVSDVVALALALGALTLAQRPPTARHTYGFGRSEVIAAQVNGILLLAGAGAVVIEAFRRFANPHTIDAAGVLVVGVLGLVVNVGSAAAVRPATHDDLNMRGALWHLVSDALGSAAVIVAALGALIFGIEWLDPAASLLIAVLVAIAGFRLLRDATRVLLDAVPDDLEIGELRRTLEAAEGVEAVHHMHVWSLGTGQPALSAHVVLSGPLSLHAAQLRANDLKELLAARFGISHTTLEVECHACVDDESHAHS